MPGTGDGGRAADELARVVKPGGGVVVCFSYPRWRDTGDAPDWWLDLGAVYAALPKHDHPVLSSGSFRPSGLEGHPGFEGMETRHELFVDHTDREGIVAHWASMSFVATLLERQHGDLLEELDAMLARRGIDEVDIPYGAELWITHRRRDPARLGGPAEAAS